MLSMLAPEQLARVLLPIGEMTKAEVRARAASAGLDTADKPDSQDVCFILATEGGRETFLGDRIPLRPGRVVTSDGRPLGSVPAVELVTVGQRRGLSVGGGQKLYAIDVDVEHATVVAGTADELLVDGLEVDSLDWIGDDDHDGSLTVQVSAHGTPMGVAFEPPTVLRFTERQRRVAPGQTVVLYRGDVVVGAGLVSSSVGSVHHGTT